MATAKRVLVRYLKLALAAPRLNGILNRLSKSLLWCGCLTSQFELCSGHSFEVRTRWRVVKVEPLLTWGGRILAPGRLRRVSVTWRRRCLPRERLLATKLQSQSVRSVSCSCTVTRAPRTADRATEAKKLVMIALAPLPFPPLRALTPSLRRVPSKVRHHCARCLRHSATAVTMSGLGLLDRMGSCLGLATGVTLRLPSAARVAWQPAQMRRQWLRARRGRGEHPSCLCSPSSM